MTRPTAGRASMPWPAFADAFLAHMDPAQQLDARAKLRQLAILRGNTLSPDAAARALGISAPPRPTPQPAPATRVARPQRSLPQLLALPDPYECPRLSPQEARALDRHYAAERRRNGLTARQHL